MGRFRVHFPVLASLNPTSAGGTPVFGAVRPGFNHGRLSRAGASRTLGFSLPEMMIVLGILMIMASIALPQMLGTIYKIRIRGAAADRRKGSCLAR